MQTFLPYRSFVLSAHCLDWQRLGCQRKESRQIYDTIFNGGRWSNHPAVKMWRGYELALLEYGNVIITEWINRGYNNNMEIITISSNIIYPPWLGNKEFHASHRAALLAKDYNWYSQFFWKETPIIDYVWPV